MTRPGEPPQAPFGITALKVYCLFAFLFWLAGPAFGILGIHPWASVSHHGITESDTLRALGYVVGLSYGALFYTIHRNLRVAWKVGWVALVATFMGLVGEVVASLLMVEALDPDRWISAVVVAIVFSIVAAYWLRWWNHQKSYFYRGERNEAR